MKFRIARDAFLDSLQQVQHVVSTRTTLPILSNVLIEADDGQLRLTTTDLDVGVSGTVEAEVSKGGARVAVVSAGEFVGELALLANAPRTASVTAMSDCQVFALGRPGLSAALKTDHQMALSMLEAVAARQVAL